MTGSNLWCSCVCVWRKECDGCCSLFVVRSCTFGLDNIFRVCHYNSMRFVLVRQNWQNVFICSWYFSIDFKFNTYAINWKYTYLKLRNFFVNACHLWLFLTKTCLRIRVFWIRHHILVNTTVRTSHFAKYELAFVIFSDVTCCLCWLAVAWYIWSLLFSKSYGTQCLSIKIKLYVCNKSQYSTIVI